jgi:serine/threonine protein kinase
MPRSDRKGALIPISARLTLHLKEEQMSDSPWWEYLLRAFERTHTQWSIKELLGQGSSAAVFKVTSPDGDAALKLYKGEFFAGENEAVERYRIALHEKLRGHSCRSLVQILDVGELEDSAFVLMEYVPWPSLDTVMGAVPVELIPNIISDVSRAAGWLLEQQLVHRDIKPANILVSPDFASAKLVDLGVVRACDKSGPDLTDHGQRRPFVATAQYSSPEYLFRLVAPSPELWSGLTIYQLGAVFQDMLTGKALFHDEVGTQNRYILAMAVLRQLPAIKRRDGVPARWGALARRALGKDLAARLRAVKLTDFESLNMLQLERARQSLGLDDSGELDLLDGVQQQRERLRLLQNSFATQVRDVLVHRLRSEGYRRVRWVGSDEQSVWLLLEIPGYKGLSYSIRFRLFLEGSRLSIFSGSVLASSEGDFKCESNSLLWEGALEQFADDLTVELVPLLSEVILLKYSKALDISTIGIDGITLPIKLDDEE